MIGILLIVTKTQNTTSGTTRVKTLMRGRGETVSSMRIYFTFFQRSKHKIFTSNNNKSTLNTYNINEHNIYILISITNMFSAGAHYKLEE